MVTKQMRFVTRAVIKTEDGSIYNITGGSGVPFVTEQIGMLKIRGRKTI